MSTESRIKNILWLGFEKFGLIFFSVLTFLGFTYFLTPEQLGLAILAIVLTELVDTVLNAILENPLVRRNCADTRELSSVFWLGGLLAVILVLFISLIYFLIDNESVLWQLLIIGSVAAMISVQLRPFVAKLRCQREFKSLAIRTFWGKLIGGLIGVSAAWGGAESFSLLIQLLVMNFVSYAILIRGNISVITTRFSLSAFISIFSEGWRIGLRVLISDFFTRSTILILSIVGSANLIGYYSFARRLVDLPKHSIKNALMTYSLPAFAKRADSMDVLSKLYFDLIVILTMLAFLFFPFYGIFGAQVITDIFGEKWEGAVEFFIIYSIICAFDIPSTLVPSLQAATNRSELGLKADIYKLLVLVPASFFAFEAFALKGVALIILLDVVVNFVIRHYVLHEILKSNMSRLYLDFTKIVLGAALIIVAVLFIVNSYAFTFIELTGIGILSVILYFLIVTVLCGNWARKIKTFLSSEH